MAHLVAKNAAVKAEVARKEVKEKNQNVPFVKMNGDDWVRLRETCCPGVIHADMAMLFVCACARVLWCTRHRTPGRALAAICTAWSIPHRVLRPRVP